MSVLGVLDGASVTVELDGRQVELTSLDKVLWPRAGFTKRDMLDYYLDVAPALVRHLSGHPLTLGRFPEGVEGRGFAQNECRGSPDWLRVHEVRLRSGNVRSYCVVDDAAALAWVANQNAIELHPLPIRTDGPGADSLVFDLDPLPPAGLLDCCAVALMLREALEEMGLAAFPKTSGAAGLHVVVPLNGRAPFEEVRAVARALAEDVAAEEPALVTSTMTRRATRAGKVLVDWLQNDPMRSTVAPYSLRATPWPVVSMPVAWEEVRDALEARREEALVFTPAAARQRLERLGDLHAPVLALEQELPPRP